MDGHGPLHGAPRGHGAAGGAGGGSAYPAESPLSPAILRGLGDRSYERRKNAALEIEALVKALQAAGDTDRICSVLALLGQDFATSSNANHRKGGLIGLAATSIGLMGDTKLYLDALLPPVLHCLDDPESRVRYYACESLYNIAKVARGDILLFFNQIFDGLCKLFADVDADVKNGSNLLDRLIKDIVTESESFDVERFIPLLQKYIRRTNPYIRQLLVGWISVLDSVPDINIIDWLPDFLEGLFNMLSDGNREIRQAAEGVLADFLKTIKASAFVEYGPMVSILVAQCSSKERNNRLTAMTWVHESVLLGGDRLLMFYSELLVAVMHCISDVEEDVREVAAQANKDLLAQLKNTELDFELQPILKTLTQELTSSHVPTRMAALRWIDMLLEKLPGSMSQFVEELLPSLHKTLTDSSDEVVLTNLQVLARISLMPGEFERVLNSILDQFTADRRLLETRGSLIIRKLCVLLNAKNIYMTLAALLKDKSDLEFTSSMVQTLNLILLTSAELAEVRRALKACFVPGGKAEDREVFMSLFTCWCHNPVSTFSLCLLAKAYTLSCALVREFVEVDITVGFLMQIDKLVQLLESPIFVHLRLQLLDVGSPAYPSLVQSLYGLLMLLPQSTAFKTLRERLETACSLNQNLVASRVALGEGAGDAGKARQETVAVVGLGDMDMAQLLKHFATVQEKHMTVRRQLLQSRSLRPPSSNLTVES